MQKDLIKFSGLSKQTALLAIVELQVNGTLSVGKRWKRDNCIISMKPELREIHLMFFFGIDPAKAREMCKPKEKPAKEIIVDYSSPKTRGLIANILYFLTNHPEPINMGNLIKRINPNAARFIYPIVRKLEQDHIVVRRKGLENEKLVTLHSDFEFTWAKAWDERRWSHLQTVDCYLTNKAPSISEVLAKRRREAIVKF